MNILFNAMNLKRNLFKVAGLSLSLLTFSCQDTSEVVAPEATQPPVAKGLYGVDTYKNIIQEFIGAAPEDMVYHDSEDHFVVENDMLVSTQTATRWSKMLEKQRRASIIVSDAYRFDIKVFIKRGVQQIWKEAVRSAVQDLNGITNQLKFRVVNNANNANIKVSMFDHNDDNVGAQARLPLGDGKPGNIVEINSNNRLSSGNVGENVPGSQSVRKNVIIHELLHTVGLFHTDSSDGSLISGTPDFDSGSLMNAAPLNFIVNSGGQITGVRINELTADDRNAVKILYSGSSPNGGGGSSGGSGSGPGSVIR